MKKHYKNYAWKSKSRIEVEEILRFLKCTPEELKEKCLKSFFNIKFIMGKNKIANFYITKPISTLEFMPYAFGNNKVDRIFLNGEEHIRK